MYVYDFVECRPNFQKKTLIIVCDWPCNLSEFPNAISNFLLQASVDCLIHLENSTRGHGTPTLDDDIVIVYIDGKGKG
jgi:hypothetical protein